MLVSDTSLIYTYNCCRRDAYRSLEKHDLHGKVVSAIEKLCSALSTEEKLIGVLDHFQ